MNLVQHLLCVGAATITAKNRVESALVNNSVKSFVRNLGAHLAHVHLFVSERGVLFAIEILHLLDDGEGNVNICDVLVALVEHFF